MLVHIATSPRKRTNIQQLKVRRAFEKNMDRQYRVHEQSPCKSRKMLRFQYFKVIVLLLLLRTLCPNQRDRDKVRHLLLRSTKNSILNIFSTQRIAESSLHIFLEVSRSTFQVSYIKIGDIERELRVPLGELNQPDGAVLSALEEPQVPQPGLDAGQAVGVERLGLVREALQPLVLLRGGGELRLLRRRLREGPRQGAGPPGADVQARRRGGFARIGEEGSRRRGGGGARGGIGGSRSELRRRERDHRLWRFGWACAGSAVSSAVELRRLGVAGDDGE